MVKYICQLIICSRHFNIKHSPLLMLLMFVGALHLLPTRLKVNKRFRCIVSFTYNW